MAKAAVRLVTLLTLVAALLWTAGCSDTGGVDDTGNQPDAKDAGGDPGAVQDAGKDAGGDPEQGDPDAGDPDLDDGDFEPDAGDPDAGDPEDGDSSSGDPDQENPDGGGFTLTVQKSGTGSGSVSGTGIDCGADCSEAVARGTVVQLQAVASAGSTFGGWSGCDAVNGRNCTVTLNADRTVTASFALESCTPSCGGRNCGPDPICGTSCGTCPAGQSCTVQGLCATVCQPMTCAGTGTDCGPLADGCGNTLDCGSCPTGQVCSFGECRSDVPALSLLSQNGGTFTLRWIFDWPMIGSTSDHHALEESTTSSTGGFAVILETTWNDHHMPWDETLTRGSGIYYYRVRTYSNSNWSEYSNVVTVSVNPAPARIEIINDLTDAYSGGIDWANMNQVIRVYMAGDAGALGNCSDACDRLDPQSGCDLPGSVIMPGGGSRTFDVGMYTDGSYCVFIQNGWWDYTCIEGFCCWEEHLAQVLDCFSQCCIPKWASFCVENHFEGTFTTNVSEWLPQQSFNGTPFCN